MEPLFCFRPDEAALKIFNIFNSQSGSVWLIRPGMMPPFNGKEDRYGSDREDDGELGSDAENEDISDTEEMAATSGASATTTPMSVPVNNGDH